MKRRKKALPQPETGLLVAGTDEAGRGCLAGPVFAAAVILPPNAHLPGVRDSKELSPSNREKCFELIVQAAVAWSVSSVSHEEIDEMNIHRASLEAMRRAVEDLQSRPDFLLVDGKFPIPCNLPQRALIKGDARFLPIAAASILAKVSRDRWMREAAKEYPLYRFDLHKGYGTVFHREAIRKYGLTPLHRKTFVGAHVAPSTG